MASHESYYTSTKPTDSSLPPRPSSVADVAPPPPPKPQDSSRTGTPSVPPVPPHPSTSSSATASQSPFRGSPALPPQPPLPPSSPFQQGQYAYQSQQPQPPALPQEFQQSQPQLLTNLPPLDSGWLPPSLKDHSTADLQPLLSQPELLDAFAKQHPAYSAALEPLKAAISTNLASAQQVAQLEKQVQQLRDQSGQLLLNHTSLQTQWRRKQSELDDALSPWGPRAMYSRLVSSINEQEAVLRAVHESFVEGGGEAHDVYAGNNGKASEKEVTDWIRRIREGTTTLEKRREMRQRWDENRVGGWR